MSSAKAYLDAGVLVAYGLGSCDIHHSNAKRVIDSIIKGDFKGVVSLLSLLETMDVIRKRVVSNTSKSLLDGKSEQGRKDYIEQESKKRYGELIKNVTEAAAANAMLVVDLEGVSIAKVLEVCNALLLKNFGTIKFYNKCFPCGGRYDHYEYKGIGPIDAMHFDLAKRSLCEVFVTTDKGFAGLDGEIAVSII